VYCGASHSLSSSHRSQSRLICRFFVSRRSTRGPLQWLCFALM